MADPIASDSTDQTPKSAQGANIIKELHQVLNRFFNWLIAVIALMSTEPGKTLFKDKYSAMMSIVATTSAYFLACVAATMLQGHIRNFLLIMMILLLQCVISVLALSFISFTIMFIALVSWVCVFGIIGFCKRRELYQWIPWNLKRSDEGGNPESPPSPESDITPSPPLPESDISLRRLFQETGSLRSQLSAGSEIPQSPTSLVSDGTVSPPLPASNSPQSPSLPESDDSDLLPV